MDDVNTELCVDEFYPKENLDITEIKQQENKILIRMKSISKSCMCPKCTCILETYHAQTLKVPETLRSQKRKITDRLTKNKCTFNV